MRGSAALIGLITLVASAPVRAQDDPLAAAEQAYVEVNFARALELAGQALESGRYGPDELRRLYRLIGVAATADGQEDRAVDAYVHLFALDPEAQLDENLSPRLRQPFLEALGRWTARRGRLALDARRLRGSRGVGLTLEDPLSMAARVVVSSRVLERGAPFAHAEQEAAESIVVPVEGLTEADGVEVYARVLDANGNRILELGSELEPHLLEGAEAREERRLAAGASAPVASAPEPAATGVSPWFLVASGGLTLVSAGVLSWSIVDLLESHDDYLNEPTLDKFYYGLDLQTRTNVLIVTTSALAVASVLLAIFTDWSGGAASAHAERGARLMLLASPDTVGGALSGSFQ